MRGSRTARRKVIKVEVSKRVLRIGAEACPLQNIARATTIRITPPRARAVGRFVKSHMSSAALSWFKSSYSGSEGGACVEVAAHPAAVHVRDSKLGGTGPVFSVDPAAWAGFVADVAS